MKTIIFDMDGLMFDTEKMWLESFVLAGKEIGYELTSELHNKIMGTNKESQIRILKEVLGDNFPHERFYDIHRNFMNQITEKYGVEPKKGLEELLNYLVKNNYTLAIASSNSERVILNNLKSNGIDSTIFKVIVDGNMIEKGKPSPDIFLKTCELLEINPQEVMVLEDSNNGIKAAYDAGCIAVLIPDLNIITEETKNMAKSICNDLHEIIDVLENTIK